MTEPDRPHADTDARKMRRRSRLRRAGKTGMWSLLGLSLLGVAAGIAVLLIIDQTLRAPQWLRDRVETRIEAGLGGLQIEFGDVELVISGGWRPRAALRDVRLSDADGRPILSLSNAQASLAMRPLLRGQVQPKTIELIGAFAVLRRDDQGAVSLAFEGGTAPVEEAPSLATLIGELDLIFDEPLLTALTTVALSQVNLRYEDAVSGRAWTVDGGSFLLNRDGDQLRMSGNLAVLTGRDFASLFEVNYSSVIGEPTASFGLNLTDVPARDIASQSVALSWLTPLRAPLSGALRGDIDATGALGPLNATLQIGAGVLQPTDQTRPVPFERAQAYFTFDPAARILQFDEIAVVSEWVTGSAEGTMSLGEIEGGQLSDLIAQMSLTATRLNPAGLYSEPITLSGAAADFRLELDPFTLTLGQLVIADEGGNLHMSGNLRALPDGWDVAIDAEMDALTPERLVALWPAGSIPKTRGWIARNLTGGQLSDVNVALRIAPEARPNVYIDFDYANSQIQFMRTMPPIIDASGQASLINNRFVTTATAGVVMADEGGPVDVSGTSFIIPDTSIRRAAPAIVRLMGRGTITSVLSLLNRPPLAILDRPGLPVTLADGGVVFQGNIALPLKERITVDEVEFFVDGLARDVETAVLIPTHTLSAPTLGITASQRGVEIGGAGRISGVPFQAQWTQPLGQPGVGSRVDGTIALGPETLEAFQVGLPPGSVTGSGTGRIAIDLPQDGPPDLELTSTLEGLRLSVPELGWSKPASQPGTLVLNADLVAPAFARRVELRAPGLNVTGQVRGATGGGLDFAEFSEVRRADWMTVRARLEGRGSGQAPGLRILGGTLDLRRAVFGSSGGRGTAATGDSALVAQLDRLQITDTIALTDFAGQFALSGGLAGPFQGRINGQTPVTGQVVPEDGRSALRVQSDDAGGVFRDAGLLKQAREGSFEMSLRPVGEPGNFDGSITVANTYIRDAPAIAALLNAISIVGLLTELAGQGIFFSEVAARFRLSPSRITLYESRATGPSMGLSMDGVYDVPDQRLRMQGVISPVYVLNQIGGILAPRRGEGLIGFNYTLTGSAQSPQVSVNPLSALTPGIFREIFRAPSPQPPPAGSNAGDPPVVPEVVRPQAPQAGDR